MPGTIISLSILRGVKRLWFIEKVLIGFGIGIVGTPFIAFMFSFAGVLYSYNVALMSAAIMYVISIALLIKFKPYEDLRFSLPKDFTQNKGKLRGAVYQIVLSLFIVLLVALAFWIRLQTYSPVYEELDPYFYLYSAEQLLSVGYTPSVDYTAWYPEVKSGHRSNPMHSHMEALWYSFYTSGQGYNHYLLSVLAGIYPPVLSALTFFFLYLFISSNYRREFAIIGAFIASFAPILVLKFFAGEMEIQPYGFFGVSFFLGTYAMMLPTRDFKLAIIAGLAFFALSLGSSSQIVVLAALLPFIPLFSLILFFKDDSSGLLDFLKLNAIVFVIGPLLTSTISGFYSGSGFSITPPVISVGSLLAFSAVLYFLKTKVTDKETSVYILIGILFAGLLAFLFTPVGDSIQGTMIGGLGLTKYNVPLDRTIAEQPPATTSVLIDHMGFIGQRIIEKPSSILATLFSLSNSLFSLVISTLQSALGADIPYNNTMFAEITTTSPVTGLPEASISTHPILLATFIFLVMFLFVYIIRLFRHKGYSSHYILYLSAILPVFIVGVIKAKFTIYAAFMISAGVGIVLAELSLLTAFILNLVYSATKDKNSIADYSRYIMYISIIFFLLIGSYITLGQFDSNKVIPSVLSVAGKVRFQDNPSALKDKFMSICQDLRSNGISEQQICGSYAQRGLAYFCSSYDENICTVAQDPEAYASKGINEQYNQKLCFYSLIDDLRAPTGESIAGANIRCQRVQPYWIDSMEWISNNTPEDSAIISWWDYGHWINFFGRQNTVLRNEHSSTNMIGRVAHAFVDGDVENLKSVMRAYNSTYVLIDGAGDGVVRTKFGALNYLSCAWDNETDVSKSPGSSQCEIEHNWETIFVPKDPAYQVECTVSEASDKKGRNAFSTHYTGGYCISDILMFDGTRITATYYSDQMDENGDLRLNKAILIPSEDQIIGDNRGEYIQVATFTAYYTYDQIWLDNGELKSGYEDRKGKYYDSILYKGYYLEDLPGFELAYRSRGNEVKIYKMK